ncbi:lipopolysaccharide biosynthesis protein [Priestia megaterium]|uniref:lipopolysaccharide biosynthesis protein n=1 Tax=Priestia megaterium TaxID=1404 RepID=UPI0012B7769E|nr:lipopolysaccharide biosynthesis protein [Priestia megaterium]
MSSLSKNAIWSFLSIIGVQIINILTNVVLARILSPETFGILGMALVFAGFAFVIQEAGLNSYLIYKKGEVNKVVSTTFLLNIIFSVLIVGLLHFSSSSIAEFYHDKRVITILNFISIGILVGAIGSTHRALLMKNNQFKDITKIDIVAEVVSSTAAIILAVYVDGLLAVSAKYLFRPLIQSLLVFKYTRYPIKIAVYFDELKELSLYSFSVLGSQLFMYMNNNVDFFLVGRFLGDKLLGIYTLAFQWGALARYYLSGAVMRVVFPEVSRKQENVDELKNMYLNVISKLSFITLPICVGLALVSHEFIYVLYGEKWLGVVPILQILLIAGSISSVSVIGGPVLRGIGRPDLEMKISILSFFSFTFMVWTGVKNGLVFVAFAELLRVLVIESIRLLLIKKYLGVPINKIFKSLMPALKALSLMIVLLSLMKFIPFEINIIILLIIKIIIGALAYVVGSFLFNKKQTKWAINYINKKKQVA